QVRGRSLGSFRCATQRIPKRNQRGDDMTSLTWRRDGVNWVLLSGRRRFGRVVPDSKWPGIWRSKLSGGRLSDMANIDWAKNAVLVDAERELEFEDRQRSAISPPKCPQNRGVFERAAPPVAQTAAARGWRNGEPEGALGRGKALSERDTRLLIGVDGRTPWARRAR